jgi:hypothetical protein
MIARGAPLSCPPGVRKTPVGERPPPTAIQPPCGHGTGDVFETVASSPIAITRSPTANSRRPGRQPRPAADVIKHGALGLLEALLLIPAHRRPTM